jgi:hypothetical protein
MSKECNLGVGNENNFKRWEKNMKNFRAELNFIYEL